MPSHHCNPDESALTATKKCQLQACPVNGGWTEWSSWTLCSQSCVHYPEKDSDLKDSKAFMSRKRYCSNPIASFGGKPCKKDNKFKYLSHEEAEEDRTDCITKKNMPKAYKGLPVPWCPEHCIYSLWGEWSHCSFTCIEVPTSSIEIVPAGAWSDALVNDNMQALGYRFNPDASLPFRQRARVLVKEARFGGKCPQKDASFDTPGSQNGTMITQQEDCTLCKEHCPPSLGNPLKVNSIRQYPKLDYPGKDATCVGYCPISCKIGEWESIIKCSDSLDKADKAKRKHEVYSKNKDYTDTKCWVSKAIHYAHDKDLPMELITEIANAFKTLAEKIQAEEELYDDADMAYTDNDYANDLGRGKGLKELTKLRKSNKQAWGQIRNLLKKDVEDYIKLMENREVRKVERPVLDGLFGGEHCKREEFGQTKKIFSGHKSFQDNYSADTHSFSVKELKAAFACSPAPCYPKPKNGVTPPISPGEPEQCPFSTWTDWGPWGKCSILCGDEGKRLRKRKCVNVCDGKEMDKNKCSPIKFGDKVWKDEYTGPCTPCPEDSEGTWSQWTLWSSSEPFKCAKGEGKFYNFERRRECIAGSQKKECREFRGKTSGVVVDKMKLQASKCPDDNGYGNQGY